ncbi:MAG: c-type cytochrome biogenesis protein CcsB [Bacteroidota bacterium]|nr:c-type cytochrome biogenesis protein CcsB [Bacteroidota bacterium]
MKVLKFFFSPVLMGVLLFIFAVSMAVATFVENDFGSSAAYNFVYDTRWFELILLLLAVNATGQMVVQKLYRRSKFTVFLFHMSFVLMIAGAALTRYTGWEGTIHIREGHEEYLCYSSDKYLGYRISDKDGNILTSTAEKYFMGSSSAANYRKKLSLDGREYEITLDKILPNATEVISDSPDGSPVISLLVMDSTKQEIVTLKDGESKIINGISIGLDPAQRADITFSHDSASFYATAVFPSDRTNMMTQETSKVDSGITEAFKPMQVLAVNGLRMVSQQMSVKGTLEAVSVDRKSHDTGRNAFLFRLRSENVPSKEIWLWDKESDIHASAAAKIGDRTIEISYGSSETRLPFSIMLRDFILERYPGSSSPSGYRSNVILNDRTAGIQKPFEIFMNNILKYKGYRFYQSSYDPDEKGTILSVNHDPAGMKVTYTGYALLFLFIILSIINRKSAFNTVTPGFWSSSLRKAVPLIVTLMMVSGPGNASGQKLIPDKAPADEFGRVLVQDQKGRTKPLYALSNDILRKVTRENRFEGLTSMQVFLGLYLDFDNWKSVPLIRVSNRALQDHLGIIGNMASFADLVSFENGGSYKLSDDVSKVYAKAPGARTKLDKEIMKVDERVNILYLIYTGGFMKVFPLRDELHTWGSPDEAIKSAVSREDSLYLRNIIPMFAEALRTNNSAAARQITASIADYQKKFAKYNLPAESKTKAEILYYKLMIFERLFPFYATIGLLMLIGLIVGVIKGTKNISLFVRILGWILFAGFLLHTFGLGIRWYIAGHSPMSNGYESMIFISWVTLLAGFIFSRKSAFALSATAVLAGMTLMVAHLSFMDPEITNLVPVLKSYWLTLHVSVVTGSYGFLGLGAILGIIIMILISLSNRNNIERISKTVDELTVINFRTLVLGLYFLTIGTFLGAVWANESWGRYWGWDPKETWSLITIVVYTLVTHSRTIPGMKDIYTFNLLSLFGFSSVLMTYFGVNYYLSGLHSYAGGDAVPVPSFVYIAVLVLFGLSVLAYTKYKKWEKEKL